MTGEPAREVTLLFTIKYKHDEGIAMYMEKYGNTLALATESC